MSTIPDEADYNPERGWRQWHIDELYRPGHAGAVPNVDDLYVDFARGFFRVISVDATTYEYSSVPWELPQVGGCDADDILRGTGPGHVSESFRIFLDENVFPHTLTFDARLTTPGTFKDIVVYLGSDTGPEGEIVSQMYDQNQTLLGSKIPLVPQKDAAGNPTGTKVPAVGYTIHDLQSGQHVTAVVYSDSGQEAGFYTFMVQRTGYVRHSNEPLKYVTGIQIESSYLDDDTQELRVPINLPLSNVDMRAIISYSNGNRQVTMPIDGNKVRVDGLSNYVASVPEQTVPIVLKYFLGDKEVNYTGLMGSDKHAARAYQVRSIPVDGTHTVKLFTYPTWNAQLSQYELVHWLVNLDRNICLNVTPFVTITQQSNPFNPSRFGVTQELAFVLNLREASPAFSDFQHVQTVNINLIGPGTDAGTLWTVEHSPNQDPVYGWDVVAEINFISAGVWDLNLSSGETERAQWLSKIFRRIEPLYDEEKEVRAPEPTHFQVVFKGSTAEYDIAQWDADLRVPNDYEPGETLFVKFIRRLTGQDLLLGVAGFTVKQRP